MEDGYKPIEDVLSGILITDLPEEWTPLEVVVLIKCLNQAGRPTWALSTSENVNPEELLGELIVQTDALRKWLSEQYSGYTPE